MGRGIYAAGDLEDVIYVDGDWLYGDGEFDEDFWAEDVLNLVEVLFPTWDPVEGTKWEKLDNGRTIRVLAESPSSRYVVGVPEGEDVSGTFPLSIGCRPLHYTEESQAGIHALNIEGAAGKAARKLIEMQGYGLYRSSPWTFSRNVLMPNPTMAEIEELGVDAIPYEVVEAAFAARDWYAGMGDPLYRLQSASWTDLGPSDYDDAADSYRYILSRHGEEIEDAWQLEEYVTALEMFAEALRRDGVKDT